MEWALWNLHSTVVLTSQELGSVTSVSELLMARGRLMCFTGTLGLLRQCPVPPQNLYLLVESTIREEKHSDGVTARGNPSPPWMLLHVSVLVTAEDTHCLSLAGKIWLQGQKNSMAMCLQAGNSKGGHGGELQ